MSISQVIWEDLMDELMFRMLGRKRHESGDVLLGYQLDDPEYRYLGVNWRTPESSGILWRPNQFGTVTLHPRESGGKDIVLVDYDFYDSPEGLQLECYTGNYDDMKRSAVQHEGMREAWEHHQRMLEEERELGLTEVDDDEARRLVELIRGAYREDPVG